MYGRQGNRSKENVNAFALCLAAMASIPPREGLPVSSISQAIPAQVPARELTNELADLLLDWPESYPAVMREPFSRLFSKRH